MKTFKKPICNLCMHEHLAIFENICDKCDRVRPIQWTLNVMGEKLHQ